MWVSPARSVSWLGFGVLLGVACTGPYASTTDSTETDIPCPIGSEGCACTAGGSCDAPLVCASNVCVSADSTTGGDVTTTSASMATANATVAATCSPATDALSGDCTDEAAPYCNTKGECVGCTGIASCAGVDPTTPACDAGTGKCVECTVDDASACADTRPICDAEAQTCRACAAHAECPGSACDLGTGSCFPVDQALHVAASGGCDDNGDGSAATPLCSIKAALAKVAQGPKATARAVLVRGGTYTDLLVVPAGYTVALLKDGTTAPRLTGKGAESLRVEAGARVFLDGLEIRGNTGGTGLACASADLWIDDTIVAEHTGGVSGTNCTTRMRGTIVAKNSSEGLLVTGGSLRLENGFVSDNGSITGRGGVALAGGAALDVVYSTLYGNVASIGMGHSIDCDGDAGAEAVTVRNAILFNLSGWATVNCGGTEDIAHSAVSAETSGMQDTNLGVSEGDQAMMVTPDGKLLGVYRPVPGSTMADVGLWEQGDPGSDFEGDARAMAAGFPGADQPKP